MENLDCCICFQSVEKHFLADLPCSHSFCYFCLKSSMHFNKQCPLCRADIPIEFQEQYKKIISENELENITTSKWMYSGRTGGWWFYEEDRAKILEESYQKYLKNVNENRINLQISGSEYIICFNTMKQISSLYPKCTRNIRRNEKHKLQDSKGISGIRYVTEDKLEEI